MLGRLIILAYHGVTKAKSLGIENYHSKHIAESEFRKQLAFMSTHCAVLSMDEVVHYYTEQIPFPKNAVAVTFDDGFENNYTVAAPLLVEYGIKATFYITAGMIDSEKMFWVDVVEDCINLTKHESVRIHLEKPCTFHLNATTDKIAALEIIKAFCKNVPVPEKDRVLNEVITQTEVTPSVSHAENYRKISTRQLQEMEANELFTIGGHSYEHNILSNFETTEQMKNDISMSMSRLHEILGKRVVHYAYPEGQPQHYNQQVIDFLKSRDIICCPSAVHGENNGTEDLFNLKRIMVGFKGTPFPIFNTELQTAFSS